MPVYSYSGTTAAGAPVSGERSAENRRALEAMLRRERIQPRVIKEKGKEFALPTFGGGVSDKELAIFTRQFSVMIDAGLPLVQCLEILGGQQENRAFQKALTAVRSSVEGGSTLANALRQHPKVFDDLYVNMVEAGETGGILDNILQRLSSYIEKNVKLKSAVTSAMIYPISVLTIMVGVVTLLLWKVVPTFITLFAGLGAELPLPTKIVIGLSNVVSYVLGSIWYVTFPLVIAAVFGAKALI
ncbi:MAG: type II secretion system F family protein, partial [Candidatus Acidoferrales bacterium]